MTKEPEVMKVSDMVDYQDGSVVSRTLIDKGTGTVTLFAFAQDQGLSEHTAPFDAMVHIIDGEAEIMISGKKYNVKKDEMIIMSGQAPHALNAKGRFKMILTLIRS